MPRDRKSATPNSPDPNAIDDTTSALIRGKARQLARRIGLPRTDLPDLEQDLAIHVWTRLDRFDPDQADRATFVRMLVGHAAATVFRGRVRYARRAPTSLDALLHASGGAAELIDPDSGPRHERALDVAAVLAALPRPLRRAAEVLQTHSVAAAARRLKLSRAAVYRRLAALLTAFAAAGLNEFCAGARTLRARRG